MPIPTSAACVCTCRTVEQKWVVLESNNRWSGPHPCSACDGPVAGDIDPTALPAEWHQWLHRARAEPPTPEDIARGQHQRELFRQRVAALEAADAARRFQEATAGGGSASRGGPAQQLPGGGGAA